MLLQKQAQVQNLYFVFTSTYYFHMFGRRERTVHHANSKIFVKNAAQCSIYVCYDWLPKSSTEEAEFKLTLIPIFFFSGYGTILMYYVPICGSHIRKIKDLRHGHVNSPWDLIQVVKLPSCSLRMKRWFLCLYVAPCSNQFTPVKDVLSPFLWHLEVNSSWQIVVQDCHINSFGLFFLSFFFFLFFTAEGVPFQYVDLWHGSNILFTLHL